MEHVTALLDEIETILARDKKPLAALAKDIGCDYHRVHAWIRVRRFNPGAKGLMLLIKWRDENISTDRSSLTVMRHKRRKRNLRQVAIELCQQN